MVGSEGVIDRRRLCWLACVSRGCGIAANCRESTQCRDVARSPESLSFASSSLFFLFLFFSSFFFSLSKSTGKKRPWSRNECDQHKFGCANERMEEVVEFLGKCEYKAGQKQDGKGAFGKGLFAKE